MHAITKRMTLLQINQLVWIISPWVTSLNWKKFTIEYDYKISMEDLDRTTIVSETVPDNLYPYALRETVYIGHWLHLYYRVNPKINLAFVAMLDIAKYKDDIDPLKTSDDIRDGLGLYTDH